MNTLLSLFRALSDPARLRILNLLFHTGELCVCDIESTLGFTQTKVSRHMAYLRRARLVQSRRQGRWIIYSIASPASPEQQTVIVGVRQILKSQSQALRDSKRILKRIEEGCCASITGTCSLPSTERKEQPWITSKIS